MTLKSALQDLRETTLAAVRGALAKLAYMASLRRGEAGYRHWGLSQIHGEEPSERALKAAHSEVLAEVLKTPLPSLVEDLRECSRDNGTPSAVYAEELRRQYDDLLPEEKKDSPAARHLSAVLLALSSLEQNSAKNPTKTKSEAKDAATKKTPTRATRSAS
jgi:hypothetical protein